MQENLKEAVLLCLVTQSCLTLGDVMDCSPPGFSVHGILQARILEWVAISFSSRSSDPGIEHGSLALQTYSLLAELPGKPAMWETWFNSWVGKIPWRREQLTTPVFWPGESRGQKSLAGYSPWGHKESDTTKRLLLLSRGSLDPLCFLLLAWYHLHI